MAAIVISTYTNRSSICENLANSHTMQAGNVLGQVDVFFFLLAVACSGVQERGLPPSMLLVMARAMRLTFLDLALPCIFFSAAVVCASEVPVATSPIITTVTQTDTQLSTTNIGTTVSTSTVVLCSDGSCIAISLVSVPIVSTITVLSTSTYVSTIGYTTIYSSVANVVVCIQPLYL